MKAPYCFTVSKAAACCSTSKIIYLRFVLLPSTLISNLSQQYRQRTMQLTRKHV